MLESVTGQAIVVAVQMSRPRYYFAFNEVFDALPSSR